MCNCTGKCGCNQTSGDSASMAAQLAELQDSIAVLTSAVKIFTCGHPIVLITDADDIATFDADGKGTGCFVDWALCNGGTFTNSQGVNYTTVNLIDKFVVAAGGTYAPGDMGGAATVSLTAAQNGPHTHVLTDPGHDHTITDPGHDHTITDPQHSHTGSSTPHTHTFTTASAGDHTHTLNPGGTIVGSNNNGLFLDGTSGASEVDDGETLNNAGAHTHTGATDATTSSVTTNAASTGISVNSEITGVSVDSNTTGITMATSGAGDPHENLPPYFAAIYIQKL